MLTAAGTPNTSLNRLTEYYYYYYLCRNLADEGQGLRGVNFAEI
jgi:hypothetical protein